MDRLIYTLLTGLQRMQESQGVTAHNLANVSTPGFRREMLAMQQAWLAPGDGRVLATRVQAGGESPHDLFRPGRVEATGRPLDVALEGGAWLAVMDAQGLPALTRRGDLRLDPEGVLRTGSGHAVRGPAGPVTLAGAADMRIAADGRIEARAAPGEAFVEVARLQLVSPDPRALARGADGLFRDSGEAQPDPLARLVPGALEGSNVEAAEALVELVEQSRAFEMQARLLATAREMDERAAGLMRVEG